MAEREPQGNPEPRDPVRIHDCIVELEKQARCEDMNIEYLVKLYKKHYPGEAVWRLVQYINRQLLVYQNVVEELKREYAPVPKYMMGAGQSIEADLEDRAKFVKAKYEELKLLPKDELDNPFFDRAIDTAFSKIRSFSKGLLKIARSFSYELLAELNVEAGVAASVQVTLSGSPGLTIGFQKSLAVAVGLGATAGSR
jgi:hypothetical protein